MPEEIKGVSPAHDKFHRELSDLKARLLELAQAAERAIEHSITALQRRDADLARQIITGDKAVNSLEEAMEEKLRFAIREGGRTVGAGVVASIIE